MLRKILAPLAGLACLLAVTPAALASDAYGEPEQGEIKIWKPYVIEKDCADGRYDCTARMDYAPMQRAMKVRPGSYWYQKPFLVYRYGDFQNGSHNASSHEAWCSERYRSYDPASDTFMGYDNKRHRCNSPYGGN
jgi:hypothetical protein